MHADGMPDGVWRGDGKGHCLRTGVLPRHLAPGWYEFSGRVECVDGTMVSPAIHYVHANSQWLEHAVLLPAPAADGKIRAVILLMQPVSGFGFDPGIAPVRFRIDALSMRCLSKTAALKRMLARSHLHETFAAWLKRCMRFAFDSAWSGLSTAAAILHDDYLRRLRLRGMNDARSLSVAWTQAEAASMDGDPLAPVSLAGNEIEGPGEGANWLRRLEAECRELAASGLFDRRYYLDNNPEVKRSGQDPLFHFCQHGWQTLRNPSPDFDVWWYWCRHLDPAHAMVNPLLHYARVGKAAGLDTRPPAAPVHKCSGHAWPAGKQIRRICLFAGYDPDGIIDDCVIAWLRELSRHADVYYLADGEMRPGELDKISEWVKGAWSVRHGAYDFGSWSLLAKRKVGWPIIEQYDELMFVNDSGYLLRDLDDVFARMDARPCDWWGLQATKGIGATRRKKSNRFDRPISIDRVKRELLSRYENEYLYDFHVGSYFLVFRRPVIDDGQFRKLINAVTKQEEKLNIIRKYEIGLTRHLIASGHSFDTFIPDLYPFHPVYSETAFELIEKGFPLLKRYFLANNHYRVPGLVDWKKRLADRGADAPVEAMEKNLFRVSDYEDLYNNLRLEKPFRGEPRPPVLLEGYAFAKADRAAPKHDHWWAFPTCAYSHVFSGNERAVFEAVRDDPSIKKIILAREKYVDIPGENVVVAPLRSREGQYYLMRARQIFIKHSPTRNLIYPVDPSLHNVINLWHGIPLKRIGYASLDMRHHLKTLAAEHAKCRAVIASSKVDAMAMASAFYPLSYNEVWQTGLPRNDFIVRDFSALPEDMQSEIYRLRQILDGRRLVLFMPTFKRAQAKGYYTFSDAELACLKEWLERYHAVLGVREHMADQARTYASQLSSIGAVEVNSNRFPNVEMLYREAAVLITDYSSSFIDFMLTGRPVVSFAYDYDRYINHERGLFYDMELVFPGPVCKDFAALMEALQSALDETSEGDAGSMYIWKRRLFFDHMDDRNARRVVEKVKSLYQPGSIGHTNGETA